QVDRGGVENWRRGALRQLRVNTRKAPAFVLPPDAFTIRMKDFAFVLQRPGVLRGSPIRVINQGKVGHEISLLRLARGKSFADGLRAVHAYVAGKRTRLPGQPYEFLGLVAPGWVGYVPASLQPGRYLVLSFATDPKTGKSQTELGMTGRLTVY
ncbi:MAG: hypothetical protein QOH23_1457, partial [Gaiellaceae bacterium]|nr:hypothetical protein [Gaiellaceae bacterium]